MFLKQLLGKYVIDYQILDNVYAQCTSLLAAMQPKNAGTHAVQIAQYMEEDIKIARFLFIWHRQNLENNMRKKIYCTFKNYLGHSSSFLLFHF